jgi:hypothetical protein
MKSLSLLAVSLLAVASSAASAAETKVTFDQFVDAVAKDPAQIVGADNIKTKNDPVTFTLSVGKDTIETDSTPAAMFDAIRARVPSKSYAAQNGYSYVAEYGRLTLKGGDNSAPAIYDVKKDVEDFYGDAQDNTDTASYVNNGYEPRSIVGSIVSYYYTSDSYGAGAAHPNSGDGITAVDTSKLEKNGDSFSFAQANLGDLVDETSLVEAIKADKWINKQVKGNYRRKLQSSRTLQEIGDLLSDAFMDVGNCYSTPIYEGKLSSFAIYDYNAAKNLVAVRVAVGYSAHACAGAAPTVQLGLLVKPRFDLEYALKDQAKSKTGLLMKDVVKK